MDFRGGHKEVGTVLIGMLLTFRCSSSYSAMMSLTGCNRTEFSCKDASCVPMVERCDGKANCKDASDEENCKYMIYCL